MSDPMKGVFQGMDIIASGLRAEMQRADIVAANIANMNDTGNAEDMPYVRKSVLFEEVFDEVKPELRATLRKLLQSSRREEDIVIPCEDGLYIEALPGAHSVMEQFKQLHRIIDVKTAQADLRGKELNNIRRAELILQENLADPDIESVKNVYYHGPAPHDGDE